MPGVESLHPSWNMVSHPSIASFFINLYLTSSSHSLCSLLQIARNPWMGG